MIRRSVTGLIALVSATALAQPATRPLSGTVLEAGPNAPLSSAQVHVRGTTFGTLSLADGTFSLRVPAGEIVLEIRRIGYSPEEMSVPLGTTTVRILLKRDPLRLDQVVVSGQASTVSRRNLANSVASVSAEELTRVSTQSIDQAFEGKIAGAQISSSTGAPGGGTRMRIRGISSILASAQPLYVIDGVIATDIAIGSGTKKVTGAFPNVSAFSAAEGEAPVNRIADLNPNDIESIEVLKGSAAAAMYGSKASGGVVLVTTKRGLQGRPRFSLRTGIGTSTLAYMNGQRKFQSLADARSAFPGVDVDQYWNTNLALNYEDLAYSNRPVNQETSLSVSGGNENTRYFVSGLLRDEEGIVHNTFARKYGLRVNLDQRLNERVSLVVGLEALRTGSDRGLFGSDAGNGSSVARALTKIPAFLDLRQRPDGTWPIYPAVWPSNPLQTIALLQNREWVWRFISTAKLNVDLLQTKEHAVRFISYGGADVLSQRNTIFSPPELWYEQASELGPGTTVVSYSGNVQSNLNLNLVHTWSPRPWLTATSQLGTQFEQRSFDQSRASAQNLSGGLELVTSGTVRDVDESLLRVQDFGVFAQTEVLVNDRLLVTAGVRADRSSNNSDPSRFFLFPKASASYRFPQLRPKLLDDLKLRLAYGETGNQPLYGQKFNSLNQSIIGGLTALQVSGSRTLPSLRPERQREIEGGIDATILGNTGTIELTGFLRNISDLLITRTPTLSTGYSSVISNGGAMRVWGMEVAASLLAMNRAAFSWTTRFNWGANRSRIISLDGPTILFARPQGGAVRIEPGKSATQIIGSDTLPQPGCVFKFCQRVIGDGNPLWNAGWGNEFRSGAFTLYALFDRQLGGMLSSGTWSEYDLGRNSRDYDQRTPSGDSTQKIGAVRAKNGPNVTTIYYQDASYLKLREVTLGWDVPPRLIHAIYAGAGSAKLTLSGRNLTWWTNFRGGDPEAENFGQPAMLGLALNAVPASLQRNREVGAYPASKSFWLTVSVNF